MRWESPFLVLAALYNGAWVVVLLAAPERVFATVPPFDTAFALAVGAVGACFAVNVVRRSPRLLALGLLAKATGPLVFVAAVRLGYLSFASWPLTLVNDAIWIPPLVMLLRAETRS